MTIVKRWKWWITAVAVMVLGATVVAPFMFIHVVEKTPPPPLSLSTSTSSTDPPASTGPSSSSAPASGSHATGLSGTYSVASGSEAEYRVPETLFGQSTTAVGTTNSVSGSMTVQGTTVTAATFTVPLSTVHSNESRRDDQFDNRIMDVAHFPNAVFTLTSPVKLASIPPVNSIVNETATGTLALHGVTKTLTFTFQAQYTGSAVKLSGTIPITFADWNIENPSAGPAQVGDSGTLGLLLVLSLSA